MICSSAACTMSTNDSTQAKASSPEFLMIAPMRRHLTHYPCFLRCRQALRRHGPRCGIGYLRQPAAFPPATAAHRLWHNSPWAVMTENRVSPQPRRAFIVQGATAFAGVGCAAALWPFIDQSNPNAGTPLPETRDVEL